MPQPIKRPKILLFDIETSIICVATFRLGPKVHISHDAIMPGERFDIMCIAYKWADEKQIHLLDWGLRKQNSAAMVKKFGKIVESADVVIAQNGDKFDIPQINTQRLLHHQPPIMWPTSEDTLKMLRKYFYFPSNKQDYITKVLLGEGKNPMIIKDWIDVKYAKDPVAWQKMLKYCKKDVELMDRMWKKLAPHCEPKAHRGLMMGQGGSSCRGCGGVDFIKDGFITLLAARYQRLQCKTCGRKRRAPKKLEELLA